MSNQASSRTSEIQSLHERLDGLAKRAGHSTVLAEMLKSQLCRQEVEIKEIRSALAAAPEEGGRIQCEDCLREFTTEASGRAHSQETGHTVTVSNLNTFTRL